MKQRLRESSFWIGFQSVSILYVFFPDGCDTHDMIQVKHIPDWVPGIPFKKVLKKYGGAAAQLFDIPFSIVKVRVRPKYPSSADAHLK